MPNIMVPMFFSVVFVLTYTIAMRTLGKVYGIPGVYHIHKDVPVRRICGNSHRPHGICPGGCNCVNTFRVITRVR